jgi:hypothetical protein
MESREPPTQSQGRARTRASARVGRGRKRSALRGSIALVLIVLGLVVWVGVRAALARGELEAAIPLAAAMQEHVVAGDGDAARATGLELADRAASAAALTSDPVWRAFEGVPALGPNLAVMRQLAAVVDDLARDGVTPLAEVAGSITTEDFRPVDGAINLEPLQSAQPAVAQASFAILAAQQHVVDIDTGGALEQLVAATGKLRMAVDEAAQSIQAVDNALQLIPAMLGAEGPRDYLVLVQNPAELRSTGGIVGAVALMHTDRGAIQLTQQASGASFPRYTEPVVELPSETRGLYGDITGQYMLNVGLTPDYSLSARLAQEMWRLRFGLEVDGVLSIDPVALSYILAATGPVALPTGDVLSAENAVSLLLTDVYQRYEKPADQDAFFAAAAASVFSAVAAGEVDPIALIEALSRSGNEHRVLVWSADRADEAVLAGSTLAGELPLSDINTQRFGVYLNDATGGKMGTYLNVDARVGKMVCRKDRRTNYSIEVTLTNVAPADASTVLPPYVTGGNFFGVTPGNVKTIVSAYGAPGLENLGLTRDGRQVPYLPAIDDGYPVSALTIELGPGESTVVHFNWLGHEAPGTGMELQMTPVIHGNETNKLDMRC